MVAPAFRVRPGKRSHEGKSIQGAGCTATGNGRFKPRAGQTGLLSFTKPWEESRLGTGNHPVNIYLPSGYDSGSATALPVVFVFHGWGEKITTYHNKYDFKALADRDNFIVVYPQGLADCASGAQC